jgi:hypothetical protein
MSGVTLVSLRSCVRVQWTDIEPYTAHYDNGSNKSLLGSLRELLSCDASKGKHVNSGNVQKAL